MRDALNDTQVRMETLQSESFTHVCQRFFCLNHFYISADEQVFDVVNELKVEVDAQRHKVRSLEREMNQKNVDIEAVSLTLCYSSFLAYKIVLFYSCSNN